MSGQEGQSTSLVQTRRQICATRVYRQSSAIVHRQVGNKLMS